MSTANAPSSSNPEGTTEATRTDGGLTDAGARRLLRVTLIVSVLLGLAWGWAEYGSFSDMRTYNVVGLSVIATVFVVTSCVAIREWRRNK